MKMLSLYGHDAVPVEAMKDIGEIPKFFGTWRVTNQEIKSSTWGQKMTRKEHYRADRDARHHVIGKGPFTPMLGQDLIIGFDRTSSKVTYTRAEPGYETAFLKPDGLCRLHTSTCGVQISKAPEDHGTDFTVTLPLKESVLAYKSEDLHVRRQLLTRLTKDGELLQEEIFVEKSRKTTSVVESTMTRISSESTPQYVYLLANLKKTVDVGNSSVTVTEKKRKPPQCTSCGNPVKNHPGPTGRECNIKCKV